MELGSQVLGRKGTQLSMAWSRWQPHPRQPCSESYDVNDIDDL